MFFVETSTKAARLTGRNTNPREHKTEKKKEKDNKMKLILLSAAARSLFLKHAKQSSLLALTGRKPDIGGGCHARLSLYFRTLSHCWTVD